MEFLRSLRLDGEYQDELDGCLRLLDAINREIKVLEEKIRQMVKKDERAIRLKSVPGIGDILSYLILYEIGDIKRFSSYKKLASYAGIVPSTHKSGNTYYNGRITKVGNKYLRWAFIESAQGAVVSDKRLKMIYKAMVKAKGKSKAKIAIAHKLLKAVYYILREGKEYNPVPDKPVFTHGQNRPIC